MFNVGGPVARSLRRRGQFLVVVSGLLGAVVGVGLGLVVDDAGTSSAVAPGRGVGLAATPAGSRPATSRTAGPGRRTAGSEAPGSQHADRADRPDMRHGDARKDAGGRQDKPGKDEPGKGKPGKGKPGKGR